MRSDGRECYNRHDCHDTTIESFQIRAEVLVKSARETAEQSLCLLMVLPIPERLQFGVSAASTSWLQKAHREVFGILKAFSLRLDILRLFVGGVQALSDWQDW